jgi:putative oxidoreductase
MGILNAFYRLIIKLGELLQPILLLVLRVAVGLGFFYAGYGKLQNISQFADFLTTLGFPVPTFHAYFVAGVEALGGLFLLAGLGTRLIALILAINMIVAYLTAHQEAVAALVNGTLVLFVQQSAFPFLLVSLVLFAFGPGLISIDAFLKRRAGANSKSA